MLQGTVTQFSPMPIDRVGVVESFCVAGRKFTYSDNVITGCFNNTSSHGGPIHEGVEVRLWAINDCILKLEIAQDDAP